VPHDGRATEQDLTMTERSSDSSATLQTGQPLERLSVPVSNRHADFFLDQRRHNNPGEPLKGGLELDAPYQRGDVWTTRQQQLLFKSFMAGIPVPAVVVNDRFGAGFRHPDGAEDWRYAVVDGKQRISALFAWFDDQLALPASWFDPDHIEATTDTSDGKYLYCSQLSTTGQRVLRNALLLPVAEAKLVSVREEAAYYLLLNNGGVAHTDADLDRARDLT